MNPFVVDGGMRAGNEIASHDERNEDCIRELSASTTMGLFLRGTTKLREVLRNLCQMIRIFERARLGLRGAFSFCRMPQPILCMRFNA